jgi:hypothetical protein
MFLLATREAVAEMFSVLKVDGTFLVAVALIFIRTDWNGASSSPSLSNSDSEAM